MLYAPTHREYQTGYVPMLDLARVADGLGPEYVLMARLHYFYDADPHRRSSTGRAASATWPSHPSVEELCLAADVLVTDYSSLMFDYAVLDRPIVIHAPDWEVYRTLRGTYFDLLAEPPGVVTRTDDELWPRCARAPRRTGPPRRRGRRSGRASARSRTATRPSGSCAGSWLARRARPSEAAREPAARAGIGEGMSWPQCPTRAAASRLVLVVGVGRSGTSLFAGILGQLGFHIPQPEVEADDTNPRGFSEPRWVVDFHTRLMRARRVTVNDARPAAWESTAAAAGDPDAQGELRALARRAVRRRRTAWSVKDPRTAGSCRCGSRCAAELGVPTVLRDDAAPSRRRSLRSACKSYGTWQSARAAPRRG